MDKKRKKIAIFIIVPAIVIGLMFAMSSKPNDDNLGEIDSKLDTGSIYPDDDEETMGDVVYEDNDVFEYQHLTAREIDGELSMVSETNSMPMNDEIKQDYPYAMSVFADKYFGKNNEIEFRVVDDYTYSIDFTTEIAIDKLYLSNADFAKIYPDDRDNISDFIVPEGFKNALYESLVRTVKENFPAKKIIVVEVGKEVISREY